MTRHDVERARGLRAIFGWSAVSLAGLLILTPAGRSAAAEDPDWPCQQRLVPEIAAGMIWSGPPLATAAADAGADDPAIRRLAGELAARRTPFEQASAQIDDFAKGLPAESRNAQLTRLFAATLELINHDRGAIVGGIKKYARGQQALAQKISASNERLDQLGADQTQERDTLKTERDWDMRIYGDRRSSLSYLCEQPVLLEKRAFVVAKAIAAHLE